MSPPWLHRVEIAWCIIGMFWLASSFFNKRTRLRENDFARFEYVIAACTAFALVFSPGFPTGPLEHPLPIRDSWLTPLIGLSLLLCLAGWSLAIWARLTLADNWSGSITLKENHSLVKTGPYALIRHPIYTALLTSFLGTALLEGRWRGLAGFVLLAVILKFKSQKEERLMLSTFGDEYQTYYRSTGAMLPRL
jgi:protein-S-isoprenylcysteine O-methyltransferase Ste14